MKLSQTVSVSPEEVSRLLTKVVEKKLGKKVTGVKGDDAGGYILSIEEQEVEEKKEG